MLDRLLPVTGASVGDEVQRLGLAVLDLVLGNETWHWMIGDFPIIDD